MGQNLPSKMDMNEMKEQLLGYGICKDVLDACAKIMHQCIKVL